MDSKLAIYAENGASIHNIGRILSYDQKINTNYGGILITGINNPLIRNDNLIGLKGYLNSYVNFINDGQIEMGATEHILAIPINIAGLIPTGIIFGDYSKYVINALNSNIENNGTITTGIDKVKKGSYFCDSFGFQEVEFDSSKSINKLETELKEMNVEQIREEYPVGTKIELINMDGESYMYPGLKGEVKSVDDIGQIHMKWENGSSLALNVGVDSFEKIEEKNKISVLLVEPFKEPKMIEIEDDLDAMQEIVGGYIEEYMPFEDDVAIVCNEEGKMRGLPLNRAIYLDSDPGKRNISDIIAGKFFVCYAPPESENFLSLPDDLAKKYDEKFKSPERFFKRDNEIVAIPFKPKSKEMER